MRHVPVLLHEVIESLDLSKKKHIIDGTLGDGGHSEAILEATKPDGRLLGIDTDPESLIRAKQFLHESDERVTYVRDNFANLREIVAETGFGPVHGILLDLGWSSPQFAERGRGFSFELDEPLDMRLSGSSDPDNPTAAEVLNTADKAYLVEIFHRYGEEKYAAQLADAVITSRQQRAFETTKQFTDVILDVYRTELKSDKDVPWIGGIHPATKAYQALRIAVNDELRVLETVIPDAIEILEPGGRLVIITFHSLEDRIVKHYFKEMEKAHGTIITKKPIVPSQAEISRNKRARSAKLRVFETRV